MASDRKPAGHRGKGGAEDDSDVSTSDGTDLEAFVVAVGRPEGDPESVRLLVLQAKFLDHSLVDEGVLGAIFNSVAARVEVDSIDNEKWITASVGLVDYRLVSKAVHPKLRNKLLPSATDGARVFVSIRFANIPDQVVSQMYKDFLGHLGKFAHSVLILSAEREVVGYERDLAIQMYPSIYKEGDACLWFPCNPEETFFKIEKIPETASLHICREGCRMSVKAYFLRYPEFVRFVQYAISEGE